jgi:hypothetical protein
MLEALASDLAWLSLFGYKRSALATGSVDAIAIRILGANSQWLSV